MHCFWNEFIKGLDVHVSVIMILDKHEQTDGI
jgi:hypothetical protein